jgi:nucleoid-associated protein YgaU
MRKKVKLSYYWIVTMSSKMISFILFFVLLVNFGAIFSIEYERHRGKDKNPNPQVEVKEEVKEEPKEETTEKSKEETTEEANKETPEDSNSTGENKIVATSENEKISTGGVFVDAEVANSTPNYKALEKSKINQTKMKQSGRWSVTNYVNGDITTNTWKVQRGDTLWEISEARYGTGRKWTIIRELNSKKIRMSSAGQRNLIFSGQVLKLK